MISDKPRVCSRNAGFPQTSWVPTGSMRRIFSWRVFGPRIPSYFLFPRMAPRLHVRGLPYRVVRLWLWPLQMAPQKVATLSAKTCSNRSLRPLCHFQMTQRTQRSTAIWACWMELSLMATPSLASWHFQGAWITVGRCFPLLWFSFFGIPVLGSF